MNPSPATTTTLTLARGRVGPAVPVLIQVPSLAWSRPPRPRARRRRLRREVRVASYLVLAILPISLAFAPFGGRLARLAAASLSVVAEPEVSPGPEAPSVSLSLTLEPVVSTSRDMETPVFLPGILLPADSIEEDSDGRH